MRAYEFITESKVINEGARIAHAEDLVFFEGSAGALRAVANLSTLPKNRDTLSIKWDGRPAIVAGRDSNGDFILTDKAGFGAKGYNGLYKSAKEFVDQKRSKGGDEGYLAKIVQLWPIVESAFPPNYRGFIQADVMWFPGDIQDTGKRYVFTPNTVTYEVDKASDIGRKIGQTKAGIAAHTYIAAPGAEGRRQQPGRQAAAGVQRRVRLFLGGVPGVSALLVRQRDQGVLMIPDVVRENAWHAPGTAGVRR